MPINYVSECLWVILNDAQIMSKSISMKGFNVTDWVSEIAENTIWG